MSGGALDYVSFKIEDAAHEIKRSTENSLLQAFAEHLKKVADATHEVEWYLSGNSSDYEDAVRAVISPAHELEYLRGEAVRLVQDLEGAIKRSKV